MRGLLWAMLQNRADFVKLFMPAIDTPQFVYVPSVNLAAESLVLFGFVRVRCGCCMLSGCPSR